MGNELLTVAILVACGVCVARPSLMRVRGHVFVALGIGLVVLLLGAFGGMFLFLGARGFVAFLSGVAMGLQLLAVVLLVLGVSGLRLQDLFAEIVGGLRAFGPAGPRGFPVGQPNPPGTQGEGGAGEPIAN